MGTDQRQKIVIIKCDLCIRSAETEVTGPLSKKGQLTAHQNCLLYSSGICCKNTPSFDDLFGFSVEDVENELKRGSRLTCNKCKKNGATVGCEVKRCKKSYHYPCAIEDGAFAEENQDKGTFGLYCKKHLHKESETSDSAKIKPSSNRDPKSDINQKTSQKRRISSNGNEHEGPRDSASKRRNLIMIDESFSSDSSETDLKLLAPLESSDLDNSGSLEPKEPGCQQSRTNSDGASFSGKLQETENREEEIILVWDTDSQSLLPSVQCVIETSQVSGCRPGAVQNSPTPEPPTPVRGSPGPDGDPPSPAVSKTPSLTSSPVLMEKFNLCPSSSQPSSRPPSSSREPCLTGLSSHGEQESVSATFWRRCNKAGCTQAIFSEFMSEISIIFNRIRSEQASQEDYDLSLRVMEASGKLAEIVANQERELQRKQERLLRAATAMKDALLALKR